MKAKTILLAAIIGSGAACGTALAETALMIFGTSKHTNNNYNWNEFNYGLGVEHIWEREDKTQRGGEWLVGGFVVKDSCHNTAGAVYGAYRYTVPLDDNWRVEATLRAGMLKDCRYLGLAALPSIGLGYKRVTVEATYVPRVHKDGSAAFVLWARVRF